MGPGLRRDDALCGALAFNELPSIQFSNSSRAAFLFPPPLRGRVREGVAARLVLVATPLSNSPPQGGREPTERVATATLDSIVKQQPSFADTTSSSRRQAPEALMNLPPKEGVGNAGCPPHPRPRVRLSSKKHTSKRVHRNHPAFPHAMVLTAYVELSPVNGLFCHRRQRIKFCLSPVGPTPLRELDASVGASGPHDFAVRCSIVRLLA
jgi:hypothetical protein